MGFELQRGLIIPDKMPPFFFTEEDLAAVAVAVDGPYFISRAPGGTRRFSTARAAAIDTLFWQRVTAWRQEHLNGQAPRAVRSPGRGWKM